MHLIYSNIKRFNHITTDNYGKETVWVTFIVRYDIYMIKNNITSITNRQHLVPYNISVFSSSLDVRAMDRVKYMMPEEMQL